MRETTPSRWPAVSYETLPWHADPELLRMFSRSQRAKVRATFDASIPARICGLVPDLPQDLVDRACRIAIALARFDESLHALHIDLPALMLRSESAASSHIEHLTSSARNIALAEITEDVSRNARTIAANVAAMQRAMEVASDFSIESIEAIQARLMEDSAPQLVGLRNQQVWVGGTGISPHGALFVPPSAARVPELLEDLVAYVHTSTAPALVTCAIAHAQFETIHPFADGNGRTGRALLHVMLAETGVLTQSSLPVSAGLLHHVDEYFDALSAYQSGKVEPVVRVVVASLRDALVIGQWLKAEVVDLMEEWQERLDGRADAAIRRLPALLIRHPVVDGPMVAKELHISAPTMRKTIGEALGLGILSLRKTRGAERRRKTYYQADAVLEILEEVANLPALLREAPS